MSVYPNSLLSGNPNSCARSQDASGDGLAAPVARVGGPCARGLVSVSSSTPTHPPPQGYESGAATAPLRVCVAPDGRCAVERVGCVDTREIRPPAALDIIGPFG